MRCPHCGADDNGRILESRSWHDFRSRRRICKSCGKRYTTYETPVNPNTKQKRRRYYLTFTDADKTRHELEIVRAEEKQELAKLEELEGNQLPNIVRLRAAKRNYVATVQGIRRGLEDELGNQTDEGQD